MALPRCIPDYSSSGWVGYENARCDRMVNVTLREQIEERNRQWRLFHEWEANQPSVERDPAVVLDDIGGLLRWCPAHLLSDDPDPEKLGIAKMRAALSLLSGQ